MSQLRVFLNTPFPYLISKKERLLYAIFISVYSMLFIFAYGPFDIFEDDKILFSWYTLLGGVFLLLSQFVIRPLLGFKQFTLKSLLCWFLAEMIVISFLLNLFFSIDASPGAGAVLNYIVFLKQVFLITFPPFAIMIWYLLLQQKMHQVKPHNIPNSENDAKLIVLKADNDKVVLAIKATEIVCVKSAGNYLELFYLKGEQITKELIRYSLKEFQEETQNTSIIRIHRSYMVNPSFISSYKKTRKGYNLVLAPLNNETIPVSSGYKIGFEDALLK